MDCIELLANIASIVTALVTASAALYFCRDKCLKGKRLENYLRNEKTSAGAANAHTIIHLMAKLGLTEAEVLHASFKSRHIVQKVRADSNSGLAAAILFEYSDSPK